MSEEKDSTERAKELLVYGPLGFALFLRDSAPQFLRMFVARGRNEVDQRRRDVGDQLDQVRAVGETATADRGPEVLRLVSNGLATLRERAEEALVALRELTADESSVAPDATSRHDESGGPRMRTGATSDSAALAISDYDDLSASQVVDRLEGLTAGDLEAIRAYEAAHRARNTILGKIEQLTRGS